MAEYFHEPCAVKSRAQQVKHDINQQDLQDAVQHFRQHRCCVSGSCAGVADLHRGFAALPDQAEQSQGILLLAASFFLAVFREVYQSITQAAICKSWHTLSLLNHILVYSL